MESNIQEIVKRAYKFRNRDVAFGFANRCEKPMAVMLGDAERFWVVTVSDAAELEKAGYQWAK